MFENEGNRNKAQVTIFIIVGLIIVSFVVLFFVFKDKFTSQPTIPSTSDPIYKTFLSCLEDETSLGIGIIETQGGYIDVPQFEPGSKYMPFSSQLDFLGNPVPYWYYVSGNNIQKKQVPTKSDMEEQLAKFIENRSRECDFTTYEDQGYQIYQNDPKASVTISDNQVELNLDMDFSSVKGTDSSSFSSHHVVVDSNLGELYNAAVEVYNKEQSELFLEKYGVDILNLYTPVNGVELSCSPLTWNADSVFNDLQDAIEVNTIAINNNNDKYFDVKSSGISPDVEVSFLNSKSWPYSFDVNPSEGPLLMANPVGNQPGFGILGFCYVPYHFVYNVRYSVLAQLSKGTEVFQFPMAVVILGNNPREPLNGSTSPTEVPDLCENRNTKTTIRVLDTNLRNTDAELFFECLDTKCSLGETSNGVLQTDLPQCVNGKILAKANGFRDGKQIYSSINEGGVEVILDRVYERNLSLSVDGRAYNGDALIYFISDSDSKTVVYPTQKSVVLGEGQYEVQVYIYKNSSITLPASVTEQCVDVPRGGILGAVGFTKKQCFSVQIPSQIVSNALAGGGKQQYYILEGELKDSKSIDINSQSLPIPSTIEQLQSNYLLYENKGLDITFE